jgi:hydroxymethylpyrimidine/phosphomethylpyrimidine kinase
MPKNRIPCVLTIAGSDSGSGAGIQADARTIQALGGYALTAITAITAQNSRGIAKWRPVEKALIFDQIRAVFDDFDAKTVKIGLIPNNETVRKLAVFLADYPGLLIVVDPVIGSTSGTRFLSRAGVRELKRRLLPLATLATPNWPEAEELTGLRVRSDREAEAAARALAGECGCAVLVKGGHGKGKVCRDCLVTRDGRVRWYSSPRVRTRNTHGTGCVLSSGIAAGLARGMSLPAAVAAARRFLVKSLRINRNVRLGGGRGPAFPRVWGE